MVKPTRMGNGPFAKAGNRLPIGVDPASVHQRVTLLEHALERMIVIPGLNRPIGIDVMLGLLPVGGSFIGAAFGGYMIWEARNLGMGKGAMARMAGNVGFDWLIGLVPGLGIIPDYFFRANTRNLRIIRKFLDKHHPGTMIVEG